MEEYRRALAVASLDRGIDINPKFLSFPPPTGRPPFHLTLDKIIPEKIQAIVQSGGISFHTTGNTGGIRNPAPQNRVADAMEADFKFESPAFLYLLGDIVYYNGDSSQYYSQFYEPYDHYPAPIFAIPGNHDGSSSEPSLTGFVRNFCAAQDILTEQSILRHAMTQPNVYWTLDAPFVTIIGLYSNVPDGGVIKQDQFEWLINELRAAPKDKALILAVHHPPYSVDSRYGADSIAKMLDRAFHESGVIADMILSAHHTNYQRFTRDLNGRQVPYKDVRSCIPRIRGYCRYDT